MEEITSFGYWVRRRRKALDLTQVALSRQVGCAPGTIKKIERDERRPSRELAELLGKHLALDGAERAQFVEMARGQRVSFPVAPTDPIARPGPDTIDKKIPHNLRRPSGSLLGREAELSALDRLLADPATRLVTIHGSGGAGKTRLASAIAESQIATGQFPDGVFVISLAELDRVERLPHAITTTVSAPMGAESATDSLLKYLRRKRLLLVLDNYEHLVDDVSLVVAMLHDAPDIKLLIASQVRLNLHEEFLLPLTGLATTGEDGDDLPAAQMLFAQAAQRVKPDFDLVQERADVDAICHNLEGLPLAIELAAGWVRLMTCKEIATELRNSTAVLTTTLRNLPDRHQNMQALLGRTWSLLNAEEQRVARQLSAFPGGFDLAAAQAVASASQTSLVQLLDWSVLRMGPENRFDMHGLLHRFARQKLALDSVEEAQTRKRHAEYYAEVVEKAGWELEPGSAEAVAAADAETTNVQAAWDYGVQQADRSVVERMMRWLLDHYRKRGDHSMAAAAYRRALHAFERSIAGAADGKFLGALHLRLSKSYGLFYHPEAIKHAREAVRLLRSTEPIDRLELAQALVRLGLTVDAQNRNREGPEYLAEAVEHFRAVGNRRGIGAALRDWGILESGRSRLRVAQEKTEESILILDGYDRQGHAQSLFLQGYVLAFRGHYDRAEALAKQALPVVLELEEHHLTMFIYRNLGDLYVATGNFDEAERCFHEAYIRMKPLGIEYDVIVPNCLSPGVMARLRGDADAEEKLIHAVDVAKQIENRQRTAISQHHLAVLWHEQGRFSTALALLDEALALAYESGSRYTTALVQAQRGRTLQSMSQWAEAQNALIAAIEVANREGIDRIACTVVKEAAKMLARIGKAATAVEHLAFVRQCEQSEWETKKQASEVLDRLKTEIDSVTYQSAVKAGQNAKWTPIVISVENWLQHPIDA